MMDLSGDLDDKIDDLDKQLENFSIREDVTDNVFTEERIKLA